MKRAALLKNPNEATGQNYEVAMRLQEGRTALFRYSDRHMAREHYDFLRTVGQIGGYYIREITFNEISG